MKNSISLQLLGILLFTSTLSCSKDKDAFTYLALGDSYTIGESVLEKERWPVQLAKNLSSRGYLVGAPKIIAQTGWRTDDLLKATAAQLTNEKYDLVSVLIGVNNQYQKKPIAAYPSDLRKILEKAIFHSKRGKEGVFVLSIPDYGQTPFGESKAAEIGTEIDAWNDSCELVCDEMGIPFFDITAISRRGLSEKELVADDGLHPSGTQYKLWVNAILERVIELCP